MAAGKDTTLGSSRPVTTKDDAVEFGLELIDAHYKGVRRLGETFQDLCLGLDAIQVKQVNTLLKLIAEARS
jgi:hypothetical protein